MAKFTGRGQPAVDQAGVQMPAQAVVGDGDVADGGAGGPGDGVGFTLTRAGSGFTLTGAGSGFTLTGAGSGLMAAARWIAAQPLIAAQLFGAPVVIARLMLTQRWSSSRSVSRARRVPADSCAKLALEAALSSRLTLAALQVAGIISV